MEAPNVKAVMEWVRENRPDCLGHFQSIVESSQRRDPQGDALMLLILIGFQAGRQYQTDHPELCLASYHTEAKAV